MRCVRSSLVIAALMFAPSCSREAPPPPPRVKAVEKPVVPKTASGAWRDSYFNLKGENLKTQAQLRLLVVRGVLELTAAELPVGTTLESEGVKFEKKKELELEGLELPLDRRLADAKWEELKQRPSKTGKWMLPPQVDWQIPVTVTVPGFAPLATTTPPFGPGARLEDVFIALATTERAWPDEVPAATPAAAAWAFNGFEALGKAEKTRDVRLVVLGELTANPRTKKCSGYVGAPDFTATSYDVQLKLVDRLTKQPAASKKFTGQPACPKTVLSGPSTPPAHAEGPDGEAMRAWVLDQLAPLSKKLARSP